MIELKGLNKRYQKDSQEVRALVDVDLTIGAGEFVAIVGPSGSGKSTLMHIVGLLDEPDAGTYFLDGADAASLSSDEAAGVRNTRIGFVFQAFHLLPKTPAVENVELPLIYSDRSDIEGLGLLALERVGLVDRAQHLPGELSGGQQQRVAIARALINDPAIILADEPTGNLDSDSGREIMATFGDLNREGKTIVVVTHDPAIAKVAHRTIQMADGRIVSDSGNETPGVPNSGGVMIEGGSIR